MANKNAILRIAVILLLFAITYGLGLLLASPMRSLISSITIFRSEYGAGEQLSKLYSFILILASAYAYRTSSNPRWIALSMSSFFLGLVLYMAESNFIASHAQPLFGIIIISCLFALLARTRSWLSLAILIAGVLVLITAWLSDQINDYDWVASLFPTSFIRLLYTVSEEQYDLTAIALLTLALILCFRDRLWKLIADNPMSTLWLLLASVLIAGGNGFLHNQYQPGPKLHLGALLITIAGFVILLCLRNSIFKEILPLSPSTQYSYLFIFLFFVLLPSLHGQERFAVSLLLWLPCLYLLARYLWTHHPSNSKAKCQ